MTATNLSLQHGISLVRGLTNDGPKVAAAQSLHGQPHRLHYPDRERKIKLVFFEVLGAYGPG
jgi:hypothetical protein